MSSSYNSGFKGSLGNGLFSVAVGGVSLDAATESLLTQATTDGYTPASGATLTALDSFIVYLKAQGVWTLLDAIWLPATNGDSDFACYNLKDPTVFKLAKVSSPTHTSNEGFTGGGAAQLDTGLALTDLTIAGQNDLSYGIYTRNIGSVKFSDIAAIGSTGSFSSIERVTAPPFTGLIAYMNGGSRSWTTPPQTGLHVVNRISSSQFNVYTNDSLIGVNSSTSVSFTSDKLFFLKGATASNAQISMGYIGGNMTSKMTEFYGAVQTYMTAIGKEV